MCDSVFKYSKVTHWFKILAVHLCGKNLIALLILLKFIFCGTYEFKQKMRDFERSTRYEFRVM